MKRDALIILLLMLGCSFGVMAQEEITTAQFKEKVWNYSTSPNQITLKSKIPVIIDFYATWCRPCKMLAPELVQLQSNYKGKIKIYKVDIDKEPELASVFGIQSIPTLFFLETNGQYRYFLGYHTLDELTQYVKQVFFKK